MSICIVSPLKGAASSNNRAHCDGLFLFGADDTGIKVESVEAFRASLERLRKVHEVHIYPGVGHAFANPTGTNYNEEAATDAWARTLEFLADHLVSDEEGS